jgi:hypothetical protein
MSVTPLSKILVEDFEAKAESELLGDPFALSVPGPEFSTCTFKLMRVDAVCCSSIFDDLVGPLRLAEEPAEEPAPLSTDNLRFNATFFVERHGNNIMNAKWPFF